MRADGSSIFFFRFFIKSIRIDEFHRVVICQYLLWTELSGKKLEKKLARVKATVFQLVYRLFLCRSYTDQLEVCQQEFSNFSFPCEGRFRVHT